ncbi:MAG: hypothetical protein WCS03_18910, partial [Bacteroidota bacterium]
SIEKFRLRKPALGLAATVTGKWPVHLRLKLLVDLKLRSLKKALNEINQEKVVPRDKRRLASINR